MKTKTISKELCKVFDKFVESIKDKETQKLVKKNTIITGGCIASMLLQEPVNDYDMYFTNKKTLRAVMEYYIAMFLKINAIQRVTASTFIKEDKDTGRLMIRIPSSGMMKGRFYKRKYKPILLTANSITLTGDIQLVTRFYGSVEEIHETYDFVHVRNYWDSKSRKVTLDADALECLLTRELKYKGSLYPLCSIIRTRKFLKRGFTINAGQYLKMVLQLNELDLTDIDVLEDQLTGVDVVYFRSFIESLKSARNKDQDIDMTYLSRMIDMVFDSTDHD